MHRDPSNRASGRREAIDLGARLFLDPRLSGSGKLACATCHIPERAWTDGRSLGVGVEEVDRNTPSVMNARFNRWFGWDGAGDSLWAQSIRPMLDAREMAANEVHVANLMRDDAELACRYRRAYGAPLPADDERVLVDVAKALAAFQETIVTARTPFDDFRDAIARGDAKAAAEYPRAAQRGAKIFVGKGRCNLCHLGPGFTHGEFHEIGITVAKKSGGMDWGRYEGIKLLEASRYNLLGIYNDDPKRSTAIFTQHVALTPMTLEQFRVPALRNVALTAPYMHNGRLATLRDVVKHYATLDPSTLHVAHVYLGGDDWELAVPQDRLLQSIRLAEPEIDDVVAFLETLTEKGDAMRRPPVVDPAVCREK
jgi:cytochrome c peroxidase